MFPKWSLAFAFIFIELESIHPAVEKDWTYVMESFQWKCTDDTAFATHLRVIRGDDGVYVTNGTITNKVDIDDEYQIEIKTLRSSIGNNQYIMTPYGIPRSNVYSFLSGPYKKMLMNDLKHCSDLMVFEGEWKEPLKPHEYQLNKCLIGTDEWPTHLQPGYYKMVIVVDGPLFNYIGELIVKVDSKRSIG